MKQSNLDDSDRSNIAILSRLQWNLLEKMWDESNNWLKIEILFGYYLRVLAKLKFLYSKLYPMF